MTIEDVKVGTEVYVHCSNRGGHGAYILISKINAKSFSGIERMGSYQPGTKWRIDKTSQFAIVVKNWVTQLKWVNT